MKKSLVSGISEWRRRPEGADLRSLVLGPLSVPIAAMTAILAVFQVTELAVGPRVAPCIIASMGASAVILYATPDAPAAKPWALYGGHLLSALVGLGATRSTLDRGNAAALAVGGALLLMGLFRCVHPPGGATALTVVLGGRDVSDQGFEFLVNPLCINLLVLGVVTWIMRALARSLPDEGARWRASVRPRLVPVFDRLLDGTLRRTRGARRPAP